jgi:hypothetical protein
VKRDFPIKESQPFLVDVFDQVPAHPKKFGDRPDRAESEQIQYSQGERSDKAVCSDHKRKRRPPESRTLTALYTVEDKIEETLLAPDWTHLEPPSLASLENCSSAAAIGTPESLFFHFGVENQCVCEETGCSALNTLEPKSMVKYRCGHGLWLLRSVRLASNNTDAPCHVHFLFSKTTQVRVRRKTHILAASRLP